MEMDIVHSYGMFVNFFQTIRRDIPGDGSFKNIVKFKKRYRTEDIDLYFNMDHSYEKAHKYYVSFI
jgi:hypothetical protein